MALVAEEKPERKTGSLVLQAVALIVATAMAAGMGWYTGSHLEDQAPPPSGPSGIKIHRTPAATGEEKEGHVATPPPSLIALDPITTNLADPTEVWVRMELSVVFDGEPDPALAQAVHQDLFAYMRTLKLRQIESASGFQHLKADLRERARIRSEGRISDILVMTLLYE